SLPRGRIKKPPSRWGDLARVFVVSPLWAIPFTLFFALLYARTRADLPIAYLASLVFALAINLCLWAAEWFVSPAVFPKGEGSGRQRIVRHTLLFGSAVLVGSFVAAVILQFTIEPGLLGTPRTTAIVGLYTVVFGVLIFGIVYAMQFYRDSVERARSEQELALARRIQRRFLVSEFPRLGRLDVGAINVSSKQVSGDFYDVVATPGGGLLLAIADVSGKGVPAALLSSMLQASFRALADDDSPVSDLMRRINVLVHRSSHAEQFATLFLARVEEPTLRLSYSNAGHNPPVVFSRQGGRRVLDRGGTVVGILETAAFEEEAIGLAPGDRVLLYTDGISEAAKAGGEMFGEERLCAMVERLSGTLDARGIAQAILDEVGAFLGGAEPGDDMTVMILRVLDEAGAGAAPGAESVPGAGPAQT
ncbi:MAG TPA: PP2C family protein-serine/threonine phosphatase, partial [Candidatus Eisenbacteria bacterium]